ncbi:unnamed protein product [Soboliphyme baturini]|uniref:C2H2-type domain-containing protein n=1 Tax=Soboliphyme baturini TaxID=241478 RepID=A0A183IDK1_9BILA|nr:unnamed protein product [Soboliphyme baturini]
MKFISGWNSKGEELVTVLALPVDLYNKGYTEKCTSTYKYPKMKSTLPAKEEMNERLRESELTAIQKYSASIQSPKEMEFCLSTPGHYQTEHENTHTGVKPFQCKVCLMSFSRRSTLWNHRRKHSDKKPFSCSTCGRAFRWKNSLKAHIERHRLDGEKTFSSDLETAPDTSLCKTATNYERGRNFAAASSLASAPSNLLRRNSHIMANFKIVGELALANKELGRSVCSARLYCNSGVRNQRLLAIALRRRQHGRMTRLMLLVRIAGTEKAFTLLGENISYPLKNEN